MPTKAPVGFEDVTATAGVGDSSLGLDALFGDYDNDGHPDLYVVNYGPNVLYHSRGDGTFEDVARALRRQRAAIRQTGTLPRLRPR